MPTVRLSLFAATCIAASACLAPGFAAAQTPILSFHIPPGPLEQALMSYGAQTGQQLLFSADLVAGRRSPGLEGRFDRDEALSRLVQGLGVTVSHTRPGVVVLKAASGQTPGSAGLSVADPIPDGGANDVEAVVVTGSLIRGVSGASPLKTITREDIDRRGYATIGEALAALPQSFNGVSTPATALLQTDGLGTNTNASTGVNLRGVGPSATLVLVDGHRLPGTGFKGDFVDVSAIPAAAVDHIEILLDGASALYGSDAVGGVVNIILRKDFSGAETRLRYGVYSGGDAPETTVSQTFGKTWSGGHAIISYEYDTQDRLRNADRAVTANSDLRSLGGTDHRLTDSHPGNVLVFSPSVANYVPAFAIPGGQNGVGLQPSSFLAGQSNLENIRALADTLPLQQRNSVYLDVGQRLDERTEISLDARYTHRRFASDLPENISIFQVSRANPYYVSPIGAASELIGYAFGDELGPVRNAGFTQNYGVTPGLTRSFGRTWRLDVSASVAEEDGVITSSNIVDYSFLNEALLNTADNPRTAYSAARDGAFNPFGARGANSAAVLSFIGSGFSTIHSRSQLLTADAKADGELFSLPGGAVKLAVGGQVRGERFKEADENLVNGVVPTFNSGGTYHRTVSAAFAELRIPIVGPDNALPGVQSLDVSLAGRVEHYDDVGTTGDPKLGVVWRPFGGLKLRATYGTSFRAPDLSDVNAVPHLAPAFLPKGSGSVLTLFEYGGNKNLHPETAETWTLGFDYTPRPLPALRLSATWFDIDYRGRVGQPALENSVVVLNDPSYAPFVSLIDPSRSSADLAKVQALIAQFPQTSSAFPTTAYGAIVDARYSNAAGLLIRGLDFGASYSWVSERDRIDVGLDGTYLDRYRRSLTPASTPVDLVGVAGQPADLKLQSSATWRHGPYSSTLTVNAVDGFRAPTTGRTIDPFVTVDLQLQWRPTLAAAWAQGVTLALTAQNLFDSDPPFYDSAFGIGYDPANANPYGRIVSVQLTKRW